MLAGFALPGSHGTTIDSGSAAQGPPLVRDDPTGGRTTLVTAAFAQTTKSFTNPVKLHTADPGVLQWGGRYYMVSTSGTPTFAIYVSDDLVNWQPTGRSVFNGTHPWGTTNFWAPELHRVGNRFAVYYAASDGAHMSVGVATANTILGPYTDLGRPLVDRGMEAIDPNFFRDDDGRQYLYWKENVGYNRIFAQEVNQAGTQLIGPRAVVLQTSLAWEGSDVEGPWVMKRNGVYYMFYSGNIFTTAQYAIGVAQSASPMAAFRKKGAPILRSGNRWKGPGHNSVVHVGANDYIVYHAWDRQAGVGDRVGMVDRINWVGGWPSVGNGTPTEGAQPYPQ
ncbi:family 43 glycosylhydrolase [Pseudonocardia acidicola]|uniref:Family 43 glycosylhydrolase n=1 Tax=Pseudonocardia acidicola TaxID=2724939 RepID=A0ABX1SD91_9PSEU|nr:family 43 glycosylhydrolase [Pseudonocardia acidicola]